ncbi:MAG: sodium/solute symporter [Thermoguttaceae bacterium]|nr:sodium/solute symporter [Thermoguttaceae bacterium]
MSLMLANFNFGAIDIGVFVAFILAVIVISTFKSRSAGESSEDYFLAGRGLSWWLIGFSLIAANISAEQFVGMAGNAAQCTGLAIASFEWIAAITLVGVGFIFLPMFLKCGIYTIPEFLEYRYNKFARSLMSLFMMIILVGVSIAAVIYLGALTIDTLFHGMMIFGCIEVNVITSSWALGVLAAVYVFIGGLKACAWADLLQGSALILGGAVVMFFAFSEFDKTKLADMESTPQYLRPAAYQSGEAADMFSGVTQETSMMQKFMTIDADKLHMIRPLSDPNIVWTTLLFGIWIPNFYYWGLNQYIMQRTLGSRSLAEGQKGIVFAAAMKLLIPFIVVIPGILAFNMYHGQMASEAMNDKLANAPTLALFERLSAGTAAEGDNQKAVFKFDKDFACLNYDLATQITKFNMKQTGKDEATFDAELAKQLEAVKTANTDAKIDMQETTINGLALQALNTEVAKGQATEKELIGYKYDAAFPLLIRNLPFPKGVSGFVLAALFGAIMSSLASMLNAASTIFTMDIFNEYINKKAAPKTQVFVGRLCVVLFMVIACLIVPILADPKFGGLFKYIQEFQGYLSPGVLVVFLFGLCAKRVPGFAGALTILLSPVVYGATKFLPQTASMNYLNQMSVTFGVLWVLMMLFTVVCPRKEPLELPSKTEMDMTPSKGAAVFGIIVVLLTITLYIYFW